MSRTENEQKLHEYAGQTNAEYRQMMQKEGLMKHPFEYQRPTPEQVEQIEKVRASLKQTHDLILETVPPSRERSLAITKLEECSMWANKGIVFSE